MLAKSTAARELVIHPVVLALCDLTLLPFSTNYQLNFSGVMHLAPGAAAQNLHRDGLLYPVKHPCPPMIMPAMWALSDFTSENGGTQIVLGSHIREHHRQPYHDEIARAAMPAGSVLIYTGGTSHGGGENSSDVTRTGMALQYCWSWLRQEENQYLANPPEIAREYPERLQRLIGYDFGGPYLGFYDGDNPHRIFEPGSDDPKQRSNPVIDARYNTMEMLQLGNVTPVPAPEREGESVASLTGAPPD
ncbi:MAG: phytanoyl-CoA dioxygenase family protein [Alphaproteobacteria bacterium]|nr:phytanoyl-CoA dioxygenase family protein [Alphaproteobacteria bacterium]